jgi:hypothetical protein
MPKKEEIPPLPWDAKPELFRVTPLPNNDIFFEIGTDFQQLSGTFSAEYAQAMLNSLTIEIYNKAMEGGGDFRHTPFVNAGIKFNRRSERYTREEIEEMLNRFIRKTAAESIRTLILRLVKLQAQAFVEGIIAIVLDMEENGIISIDGTRADIWNQYAEEVARTVKREHGVDDSVRTRRWNEQMRRKGLTLYEDTLPLIQELKRTYFSSASRRIRQQNPKLKSWNKVLEEYPHLKGVLVNINKSTPRELTLKYIGEVLGSLSESYTWQQIKEARRERELSEKKKAEYTEFAERESEKKREEG